MIKYSSKIKAFTLNEMLVVLLITAIVVGMSFAVLSLVQQQMHGIDGNYKKNTAFNLLKQSLWFDVISFDRLYYDKEHREILFVNGLDQVRYQFMDEVIVRKKDTFKVEIKTITNYFENSPQQSGEIDAIELVSTKKNGSQRLFIFKQNATTSYLNQ